MKQKLSNLLNKKYSVLFLSLFLLLILLFAAEFLLRTEPVTKRLNVPYLGSSHRQLEVQFARIKLFAEQEGKIDCIFVGSSMVWLGVNPEEYSDSYKEYTGEDVKCFNFGVATMPAGAAADVAEILVNEYHPKMILFGTSARDYAIPLDAEDSSVIIKSPWLQYQLGNFSFSGWLYAHSFFYAHVQNLNRIIKLDQSVFTDIGTSYFDRTGFLPKQGKVKEVNQQAAIEDFQKWLADYQVLSDNVVGLEKIANLSNQGIQVVIFEVPLFEDYYNYFGNGENDYIKFVNAVSQVSSEYSIPFIRSNDLDTIPESGWWNENHLNKEGADIFSRWLGEQIGQLHVWDVSSQ